MHIPNANPNPNPNPNPSPNPSPSPHPRPNPKQDDSLCAEACDGGTTATVVCLVDGSLLVQAQCGDSTALLGGMLEHDANPQPYPQP